MVEGNTGFGAGCRFGSESHRETGFRHHHQVVGTVAHGNHLIRAQTQFVTQACQMVCFSGGINDVADDAARELATGDFQLV